MESKRHIDFLVEKFFDKGNMQLNEEEIGLTFEQVELLKEEEVEDEELDISTLKKEVNSLKVTPIKDKEILKFLEKKLDTTELETIEVTQGEIFNFLKEKNIIIELGDKEKILNLIKNILNEDKELRDYLLKGGKTKLSTLLQFIRSIGFKNIFSGGHYKELNKRIVAENQYEERKEFLRKIKEKEFLKLYKEAHRLKKVGLYEKSIQKFTDLLSLYNNLSEISKEAIGEDIINDVKTNIDNLEIIKKVDIIDEPVEDCEGNKCGDFFFDKLKTELRQKLTPKEIEYGKWVIEDYVVKDKEFGEIENLLLKRVINKQSNPLEVLLGELGYNEILLKHIPLKKDYYDEYKKTLKGNIRDDSQRVITNILSSNNQNLGKINQLTNKALNIIDNIIILIKKEGILKQNEALRRWYKNMTYIIPTYVDRKDSNMLEQLYEIVFDLNELYKLLQENPNSFKSLIKNTLGTVNSSTKARENFGKIREQRNKLYEGSFSQECEGKKYFKVESAGDKSSIIAKDNLPKEFKGAWNKYLKSLIDDKNKKASDIVTEISYHLTNKVDKYDLSCINEVELTPLNSGIPPLSIPTGAKVEVKLPLFDQFTDYHLSEFFGIYKNDAPTSPNELEKYNDIIEGLKNTIENQRLDILKGIKEKTGTFGVFYGDYIFTPMSNINLYWSTKGQRNTEKRLSIRMEIIDSNQIYQWRKGNCNIDNNPTSLSEDTDTYINQILGF